MTRLALSALLATLALFGAAPQASAHTELVSSDPASGQTLPQRPERLVLTFTEPVPAESAVVTVQSPDGSAVPLGEVTAQGATLTVPLQGAGPTAGQYTVSWQVEALDGDFVDGRFAFALAAPPDANPRTTPPATSPAAPPAATSGDTTPPAATGTRPAATVTAVRTATSTPAATPGGSDGGGGVPPWVWIAVAAVLAVVGIAVGVGLSRRARGGDGEPAE